MLPKERWVDVEEVATHLAVVKDSIYRWIDKGFPAHRVGRLLRFKLSEVDNWVTAKGGEDSGSSSSGKATQARPASRKSNVKKKSRHG